MRKRNLTTYFSLKAYGTHSFQSYNPQIILKFDIFACQNESFHLTISFCCLSQKPAQKVNSLRCKIKVIKSLQIIFVATENV
jgi:hypothetical protein